MLKEEFTRSDGSIGYNYKPEENDFIVCKRDSPWKSEEITARNGNKFHNYGIRAEHNNEIIFVKLTQNQYNQLVDLDELKDKTIKFVGYDKVIDGEQKRFIGVELIKN